MSPEELEEGFLWAKKYCSAPRSIFRECSGRLGRIGLQLWDSISQCISVGQNKSERVGLAPKDDLSGQGHGRAGSIPGIEEWWVGRQSGSEVLECGLLGMVNWRSQKMELSQ